MSHIQQFVGLFVTKIVVTDPGRVGGDITELNVTSVDIRDDKQPKFLTSKLKFTGV